VKTRFGNSTGRARIDSVMTPMIDVVFLLLIFFLATSSFQRIEKLMPSAVSAESNSQGQGNQDQPPPPTESDLSDCVIKISRDGKELQYRFNDAPIASLKDLAERMRSVIAIRPDVPIIVDPEDSVSAGDALRVYDLAKAQGSLTVYMVAR
jgi:biopolymer transport protein ExbD